MTRGKASTTIDLSATSGRAAQQAAIHGLGRSATVAAALVAVLAILSLVRLYVGSASIGWPQGAYADQILHARAYRLIIALVVGVALSISGVALQALLRNPLAEPYILGLSTGAAAGVMAQGLALYYLGIVLGAGWIGALVGAMLSMAVVYVAGQRRGMIDPLGLLLTGVVLSTINGALMMLFNYLVGPGGLRGDIARWMMGYLNENVGSVMLWAVGLVTLLGLVVLMCRARAMDIATLSDAEARSLGVNLAALRTLLFSVAGVLAAGAVVLAGPIAFVGLIAPHIARLLLGPRHGPLLIASALVGASVIVAADIISSVLALELGVGVMPIGIFTAIVGGIAFLWMLRPQMGRGVQ